MLEVVGSPSDLLNSLLESDDTLGMFLDFSGPNENGYGKILDEWAFWQEFTGIAEHET